MDHRQSGSLGPSVTRPQRHLWTVLADPGGNASSAGHFGQTVRLHGHSQAERDDAGEGPPRSPLQAAMMRYVVTYDIAYDSRREDVAILLSVRPARPSSTKTGTCWN
jgi:hypothetical protein